MVVVMGLSVEWNGIHLILENDMAMLIVATQPRATIEMHEIEKQEQRLP